MYYDKTNMWSVNVILEYLDVYLLIFVIHMWQEHSWK